MIISSVEVAKRHKDRVNIYVDGEFYCSLTALVAVENRLIVGREVTEEQFKSIMKSSESDLAFSKAANYLARGSKTKKQIGDYLSKKGFDEVVVSNVVGKLVAYNYVNDEEYAAEYVKYNQDSKGARRIERELLLKGIDKQLASASSQLDEQASQDACNAQGRKYLRNKELTTKALANAQRYLLYRGYSYGQIETFFRTLKETVDDDCQ